MGAQDEKDRTAYTEAYGVPAVGCHAADWGDRLKAVRKKLNVLHLALVRRRDEIEL